MISDILWAAIESEAKQLTDEAEKMDDPHCKWAQGYKAGITMLQGAIRNILLAPENEG